MLRDEGQSNTGINGFDRRTGSGSKSTLTAMVLIGAVVASTPSLAA